MLRHESIAASQEAEKSGPEAGCKECAEQREVGVVLHPFPFASCPISGHKGHGNNATWRRVAGKTYD